MAENGSCAHGIPESLPHLVCTKKKKRNTATIGLHLTVCRYSLVGLRLLVLAVLTQALAALAGIIIIIVDVIVVVVVIRIRDVVRWCMRE